MTEELAAERTAPSETFAAIASGVPSARAVIAGAGLVAILCASVLLVVDAAAAPSFLVPGAREAFPRWMAGPLRGLGEPVTWDYVGVLLTLMLVGWGLVLTGARALPRNFVIAAIVVLHVLFLLAPPLLSADIFGYVGFARIGAIHHLNPYVFGTASAPADPVHPFLRWRDASSPYGPLFTLFSYVFVPLGVAGAVWAFKALAFAASIATVALVWRLCERRGHDPRIGAALVGLNPLLLAFEVGGGHNDALVVLATVAGIGLVLTDRRVTGAASTVLAAAIKPSAAVVVPFAMLGARDRGRALTGAAAGLALAGTAAVAGFGAHALGFLSNAPPFNSGVARHSVPSTLTHLFGGAGVGAGVRTAAACIAAATILYALWRTWKGADWITSAGWATLGVLLTTTWLLPWYATWLTPLAALSDSRRLRIATVLFVVFATATRIDFIFPT